MPDRNNRTIWTQTFAVRAYEAGPDGRVRPEVLCDYLQDAAANHADVLGVSADDLGDQAWVLSRLILDIDRLPAWKQEIAVTTWPSGLEGIFATRDFELQSGGAVIARGTTAWLLIDRNRRRPARPSSAVTAIEIPERPRALTDDFGRVSPVQTPERHATRVAGAGEEDQNGHVNNVRYAAWGLDALPPDWHRRQPAQQPRS